MCWGFLLLQGCYFLLECERRWWDLCLEPEEEESLEPEQTELKLVRRNTLDKLAAKVEELRYLSYALHARCSSYI